MKKLFIVIAMVLASGAIHAQQNVFTHKVKVGETLYAISQMYGVTVNDIKNQNAGLTDNIMVGQTITVPQSATGELHYTIQAGETLYAISKKFGVTSKVITDANPGLSATNFKAGALIVIPRGVVSTTEQRKNDVAAPKERTGCKLTHVVEKKETVYSLSKKYNVTQADLIKANPALKEGKLKKGMTLCIPYPQDERFYTPSDNDVFQEIAKQKDVKYDKIKVAVILPFGLDKRTSEANKMIDLYKGFLLAVDSIKNTGANLDVYAYEEKGTDAASIQSILANPEMKGMNLIVGPVRPDHIDAVAQFAHENNIVNVIPTSTKQNAVNSHKTTFQVNSPQSYTYSFVYEKFVELNSGANVIFVNMSDKSDYADYLWGFKKYLEQKNLSYVTMQSSAFVNVAKHLKKGVRNIIIPSASTSAAFEQLTNELNSLNILDNYEVSLFGYPDWQTFSDNNEKMLDKYKCSFYTTFFSDPAQKRVANFSYRFKHHFKKAQISSCPKFGELGYDIGAFFLGGLNTYGGSFVQNVEKVGYTALQNPFCFVRKNNWSGFENTVIMFVTYKGNDMIEIKRYE